MLSAAYLAMNLSSFVCPWTGRKKCLEFIIGGSIRLWPTWGGPRISDGGPPFRSKQNGRSFRVVRTRCPSFLSNSGGIRRSFSLYCQVSGCESSRYYTQQNVGHACDNVCHNRHTSILHKLRTYAWYGPYVCAHKQINKTNRTTPQNSTSSWDSRNLSNHSTRRMASAI